MTAFARALDRIIGGITWAGGILVLPLALLLFLRDVVQQYSREANDLAQCLFAVYVSVAISYATRRHAHLATDIFAQRYPQRARETLARIGALAVLVPWSLFILYAAWPMTAQSVRQLEAFPETFNPGYFVLKIALLIAALLVLLQALLDVFRGGSQRS